MKLWKATNRILMNFSLALLLLAGLSGKAVESSQDAIAIKGYDTVAYFNAGKAIKGKEEYTFQWRGKIWYFSNKENKDLFATNPEEYAPQYNGYCAWAMTEARKAETDPEIWKIVNGKLYLHCSEAAYQKWSKDIPGNIKKADTNWLKFFATN